MIKYFYTINSSITPTISTHKIGVNMINQKRLEHFKKHYNFTILELYGTLSFLEIITREEEKFLSTISLGEKKFETIAKEAKGKVIKGEDAFLLYDTFGFPYELTLEYASELGLSVDHDGFINAMNENRCLRKEKVYAVSESK